MKFLNCRTVSSVGLIVIWQIMAQFGVKGADNTGIEAPRQTTITPKAKALLDQVSEAYSRLQTVELDGTIRTSLPTAENPEQKSSQFTSGFAAPNKFRHELESKLIIGSTGQKAYVYQQSANAYIQGDLPEGKVGIELLPAPIPQLLQAQNPSLLFAVIKDPIQALVNNMLEITTAAAVQLNGVSYAALRLAPRQGRERITWLIDPQSHLVKRFTVEIPPEELQGMGMANMLQKPALTEIDYGTITLRVQFPADHFAWTPPPGAQDMTAALQQTATNLVGRAAPEFTLDNLQGQTVSLANLKGHVVVLDFWATWCLPCVRALPELEQFQKEQAGKKVQVFAVNLQEDREKVHSFLQSRRLNLPVLLDPNGDMAQKYHISAIPETVVIGKDGQVKRIFIGNTPQSTQELRQAVEAAARE